MASYTRSLNFLSRIACATLVLVVLGSTQARCVFAQQLFSEYDLMMFERPSLPRGKVIRRFPDGLQALWSKALERPDAELQRLVIDTLGIAHEVGLPEARQSQEKLIEVAKVPDQRIDVLRAIAATLVEFDALDQAELLVELSAEHGSVISEIVEPALADWKSPLLKDQWLQRVRKGDAGLAMMTHAINGLAALKETEAIEPLQQMLSKTGAATEVRMTAARAIGQIQSSGLVETARAMLSEEARHPQLNAVLAVHLLSTHDDAEAVELLGELAMHQNTAVQSIALQRLYEIDFKLVDQLAEQLIESRDANVRRWVAKALIDSKSVDRIRMLCSMLDDENPRLRRDVRDALVALSEETELREEVIARTTDVLNGNAWRGCEQACVVLTRLDHKPSGPRMVELLGHPRGDVNVAAAWGLSKLRIKKLLPDMLEHAQSILAGFRSGELTDFTRGAQMHVAHLFNAFGDQEYREAEPLLRQYIPKKKELGLESRAAAAWALGMLYVDDPQEDLTSLLSKRIADSFGEDPETTEMQQMSAVSIGRMKDETGLPVLRRFVTTAEDSGLACYWAIEQMTGEPSPVPEDSIITVGGWFLSPITDEDDEN